MKINKYLWGAYLIIIIGILLDRGIKLTSLDSPEKFYFYFLYSFDPIYYWTYASAIAQWTLTCIHVIPLLLYMTKKSAFPRIVWQILFLSMVTFNISGHHYHLKTLQSAFHYNIQHGLLFLVFSVSAYIPLYAVSFYQAFIFSALDKERR
jgi:hypothetical protein